MTGIFKLAVSSIQMMISGLRTTFPYLVERSEDYRECTEEYPDRVSARMPEDLPQRFRGILHNDINVCSGCRYCSDICPTDCIRIETEPGPERNVSWVAVFDINHSKCMFCGLCVEVCPTSSLKHTREYQASSFDVNELILSQGRGWASAGLKEKWAKAQKNNDAKAEEIALLERSPVGGELIRRKRKEDET